MDFLDGKLYFSLNYDLTSAEADLDLLAWSAFKLAALLTGSVPLLLNTVSLLHDKRCNKYVTLVVKCNTLIMGLKVLS